MTKEELKQKCTERARIFQQAMESCHSSSPMDCIEWFADRIADLEKENAELKEKVNILDNCDRLGDVITEAYKEQLTKAKEIIREYLSLLDKLHNTKIFNIDEDLKHKAEAFLNSEVEK